MTKATPPARRLGIDFGNVIQGGDPPGAEDTSFLGATVADAMRCPWLPGAMAGVRSLVERFQGRVWIVSKAGATMQRKTLAWLHHNEWWSQTGMEPWSVAFVLHRAEKAKVARALRLTHFIDDRYEVLEYLADVMPLQKLYHFGQTTSMFTPMPDWTHAGNIQ